MITGLTDWELGLILIAGLIVLWTIGRYWLLVGMDRRLVRGTRKHWQATLVGVLILGFLGIFAVFQVSDRAAAALIAVFPPSIYYLYSEHLDRPTLSIDSNSDTWSVAPMRLPQSQLAQLDGEELSVGAELSDINEADEEDVTDGVSLEFDQGRRITLETSGSQAVRPAVFLSYDVVNEGKATAERVTVQLQLTADDDSTEHIARWTDPANSVEYDLRPSQRESVHIAKTFLTATFIPISPLATTDDQITEDDISRFSIRPQFEFAGNPTGPLDIYAAYDQDEFEPVTYVPREKRPERTERSIAGGWEGTPINQSGEDAAEYAIEARLIADNYRTDWELISEFDIPDRFVVMALDEDNWQNQWTGHLEWIKERSQEHASAYLDNEYL